MFWGYILGLTDVFEVLGNLALAQFRTMLARRRYLHTMKSNQVKTSFPIRVSFGDLDGCIQE